MRERELREKVVNQAKAWVGRKEADNSHRVIIDAYNDIRPLPRGYRMSYTDPWCAAFVSAVGFVCGLTSIIYPECACDPMIKAYEKHGCWFEDDNYDAQPGDIIFYDWADNGVGDSKGSSGHVGIVAERNGNTMKIIEGNISDACGYRTIQRNGRFIRGFGVPDYKSMTDTPGDRAEESADVKLPTLKHGDVGTPVLAMQAVLIRRGFNCGWCGADGEFGDGTLNAVRQFRAHASLPTGDVCDEAMWLKLIGCNQ